MSDVTLDEKRVYADCRDETVAYVASEQGVATVSVAGGQVGRFSLFHRCRARDIAGSDDRLAVATDEDVLVGTDDGFASTGFGPAVAVGVGGGPVAAGPNGRVARFRGDEWVTLGTVADVREMSDNVRDGAVRAMDGDLLAADDGVYRLLADSLAPAGLDEVRDVAATGLPLAATDHGLYYLGNGWMDARDGAFATVCSDGERAHAVAANGTVFERVGHDSTTVSGGQTWRERSLPAGGVVDVAYADCICAVTGDGTVLVAADPEATADGTGGWRTRSLGLTGVAAIAVP